MKRIITLFIFVSCHFNHEGKIDYHFVGEMTGKLGTNLAKGVWNHEVNLPISKTNVLFKLSLKQNNKTKQSQNSPIVEIDYRNSYLNENLTFNQKLKEILISNDYFEVVIEANYLLFFEKKLDIALGELEIPSANFNGVPMKARVTCVLPFNHAFAVNDPNEINTTAFGYQLPVINGTTVFNSCYVEAKSTASEEFEIQQWGLLKLYTNEQMTVSSEPQRFESRPQSVPTPVPSIRRNKLKPRQVDQLISWYVSSLRQKIHHKFLAAQEMVEIIDYHLTKLKVETYAYAFNSKLNDFKNGLETYQNKFKHVYTRDVNRVRIKFCEDYLKSKL